MFWQNGSNVMAMARNVFSTDGGRIEIGGGGNIYDLVIHEVRLSDEGSYTCQIPGGEGTIKQKNMLTVNSKYCRNSAIVGHTFESLQICEFYFVNNFPFGVRTRRFDAALLDVYCMKFLGKDILQILNCYLFGKCIRQPIGDYIICVMRSYQD